MRYYFLVVLEKAGNGPLLKGPFKTAKTRLYAARRYNEKNSYKHHVWFLDTNNSGEAWLPSLSWGYLLGLRGLVNFFGWSLEEAKKAHGPENRTRIKGWRNKDGRRSYL
jgi:hypothetical protein